MIAKFWILLSLLLAQNMLDLFLLRIYTGKGHETFPLLAHTLQMWGLDGSIWTIRAILFTFGLTMMIVKRAYQNSLPYLNDILIAVNAIYLAGMTDELFFTGIVKVTSWTRTL